MSKGVRIVLATGMFLGWAAGRSGAALADAASVDNHVGETAHFIIDTKSGRTSSLVNSGDLTDIITTFTAAESGPGTYSINENCNIDASIGGKHSVNGTSTLSEYFYTPEFLDYVRAGNIYVDANFKVKHQGYVDATTMEGKSYPHSDKILIYDVVPEKIGFPGAACLNMALVAAGRAEALARGLDTVEGSVSNVQAVAVIQQGATPELGVVKVDASGVYSGFMNVKIGADYTSK